MKFYRDGYNRTNLDIRVGPVRVRFSVTDEPWDPSNAAIHIEVGEQHRRYFVIRFGWG